MSTTTTINPVNSGKPSDGKNKTAAFAATAASAAGLGVAGSHIAPDFLVTDDTAEDENIVMDVDTATEEVVHPENESTGSTVSSSQDPVVSNSTDSSTVNTSDSDIVEPQPITESAVTGQPDADPINVGEPDSGIEPNEAIEPEPTALSSTDSQAEDVVNPDEIAEAIIAEEKIDPNDIDMTDIIEFDEIGTVYTVDGESYTAAAFHDTAGNDLIMIDVDGDNVFDVITDYDGNLIAEVPGNISVGDAQENIEEDDVYLAYDNELDNVDEYGQDSLAEDLMG